MHTLSGYSLHATALCSPDCVSDTLIEHSSQPQNMGGREKSDNSARSMIADAGYWDLVRNRCTPERLRLSDKSNDRINPPPYFS